MLTSSSPTLSAPPSPSTTQLRPPYHAVCRPSAPAAPTARSPRVHALSAHTARRFDGPPHQTQTQTQTQPQHQPQPQPQSQSQSQSQQKHQHQHQHQISRAVPLFAPQQASNKRAHDYADASTQYSPDGYPPTYHPSAAAATATPEPAALSAPAIVAPPQPDGVAAAAATAADPPAPPPEPVLRVDPAPANPQHVAAPTRKTPREAPQQQRTVPVQADDAPPSPAKRLRPPEASVKVMPLKYETCDVKDLGVLISDMLMELVRLNDDRPLRDGQLTRFHSRAPPGISVRDYLLRLIVHATLSPPILLAMVFYVDKLCATYPAFTISSLTVHRFLITAATVAAKGLSDSFWTNTLYARVGGVSVRELALLELEFLRKLDWRIVPKPEVLVDYYKGLVERGEGYTMEKEPESALNAGLERVTSPTGSATGIHTSH